MLDTTLAAQLDVLTASARVALADYPQLARQIRAGMVLAACGMVREVSVNLMWFVNKKVVELDGIPERWHCNCEQGRDYGPLTGNFLGYPGRICKHIAAVAMARDLQRPIMPVANVWEMVERLCSMPPDVLFGEGTEIHFPRNKMRLLRDKNAYVLAYSHYHSEPVAQLSGGEMFLLPKAYSNYNDLLIKAGIKQPAQQKEFI